jgi:hypothetical protein
MGYPLTLEPVRSPIWGALLVVVVAAWLIAKLA